MRYILPFLLIVFFPITVFAARMVEGTVPQVQPLQPPAVGVHANVNGNINYQVPNQPVLQATSGAAFPSNSPFEQSGQLGASSGTVSQTGDNRSLIAGIIFIFVVGGAVYAARRYLK